MSRPFILFRRVLAVAISMLAAAYAADTLSIRYRISKNLNPYGVVRVRRYYSVSTKSGKPEYYFDQPTDQTCLHSLFPHFGYPPCWYLQRRATQEVKM